MIYEPTYRAARAVASSVEKHFAEHVASACREANQPKASQPSAEVIEAIIDAAFWTSLRKEEGLSPKISLAYLAPWEASDALLFGHRLPLSPDSLTKLAPGLERPGIHICVWNDGQEFFLWGTTRNIPNLCFILDVSEPGLLVIKHRRLCGFGKYTNVAVLKGDQVKIIDDKIASWPDTPPVLKSLLDLKAPSWDDSINLMIQLAVSMKSHGHGGALLVVPAGSERWRESIVNPMQYPVSPAFAGLTNVSNSELSQGSGGRWQNSLSQEVEHIAGLTAIDGATVMSDRHELLAFGVKIGRAEGSSPAEKIALVEPIKGSEVQMVHPTHIGGTRHLSAAQFIYEQRDCTAYVASQDGHFTVFSWSPHANSLRAYRIDTLLL